MDFASLHGHSTFSFLDGYGLPRDHAERAAELGMTALALTEHGNVSSHARLEQAARAAGVKPVYGLEAYTGPPGAKFKWHLGLLAMDAGGYRNLMRIVTQSWEDFYYEPTVYGPELAQHHQGIAVLSGCSGSKLACDLLGGKGREEHAPDLAAAAETAARFRDLLGDRYYLEVQAFPELERTRAINTAYERISGELRIPLIATCDVHYPRAGDSDLQVILHATGRGNKTFEGQAQSWGYDVPLTYPESDDVLLGRLAGTGLSHEAARSALDNSAVLAERCSVMLPRAAPLVFLDTADPVELLKTWLNNGWLRRDIAELPKTGQRAYRERARRELGLIEDKRMADFFLITADAVQWAKAEGIAVGVRGSAVASLACYLLGITEIDPLRYPAMMLERFLDPSRADYPDIDLDVDDERRDEIRLYLERKYGAGHVGNVSNWTRFRGRNSLDDVARVFRLPRAEVARLKEMVIERGDGDARQADSLEDTEALVPGATELFGAMPELRMAQRLEGNLRGYGVHAGGLVVSTTPLTDLCALYTQKSGAGEGKARDLKVLSLDKRDAEYLGALKLDLLGLSTMSMLAQACELSGIDLGYLYQVPDDDSAVMAAFRADDVTGVFQFDGRATRNCCREVQPRTFMELADLTALSRPGPLLSGSTDAYITAGKKRGHRAGHRCHAAGCTEEVRPSMLMCARHWRMVPKAMQREVWAAYRAGQEITKDPSAEYLDVVSKVITHVAELERGHAGPMRAITESTRGQLVYQEQLLRVATDIGGFSWEEASRLRKIIHKKLGKAQFMELFGQFAAGAAQHGITQEQAGKIWKAMSEAAAYAFNIAHAVSYAKLAYWCMWLKVYHPDAFYTASLRKASPEQTLRLLRDAHAHKITISPPHFQRSRASWALEAPGRIRAGYMQVPGIASRTAAAILDERSRAPFLLWRDLERVKGVGPKTAAAMEAFAQADDPFGLQAARRAITAITKAARFGKLPVPIPDCDSASLRDTVQGGQEVVYCGIVRVREYWDIAEEERAAGNPELKGIDRPELTRSAVLKCHDDGEEEVYIRISRFAFGKLADDVASVEPGNAVVVSGLKGSGMSLAIRARRLWAIEI